MRGEPTKRADSRLSVVRFTFGSPVAVCRLFELDQAAVRSGALEPWTEDNYAAALVDKRHLSFAIVDTDSAGEIVAYRIASGLGKLEGYAHTHRTMVRPDLRRQGLGSTLLRYTSNAARVRGYKGLTGKLNPANDASRRFLEATGWQVVTQVGANELWRLDFVSGDMAGGDQN